MGFRDRIKGLMGFFRRTERHVQQQTRDRVDHVIILDGTMSTLDEGEETNVGHIYKLLAEETDSPRTGPRRWISSKAGVSIARFRGSMAGWQADIARATGSS